MFDLPGPLGTLANFLVIVLGFGSIVFIHELGHFVAAKWAGIRVLAFSIGFGNVLFSYRKGFGFRKGSSDQEYEKLVRDAQGRQGDARENARAKLSGEVSPTEYRLSMLPLGGYVKMLGQEDLNPEATSDAPDSYQNCPVGKRMVVISAGVIMNMIMAAVLFIVVFMVGLKVLPPVVGYVAEGSPAQIANPVAMPELAPGLKRSDRIVWINGKKMHSYEAILPEIAMSSKSKPAIISVERTGFDHLIEFEILPKVAKQSGLLDIGIAPPVSTTLKAPQNPKDLRIWKMTAKALGFGDLEPGDTVISANGQPVQSPFDLLDLAKQSTGQSITITYEHQGQAHETTLHPVPALQIDAVKTDEGLQRMQHILGLSGVMMVDPNADPVDIHDKLRPGDIFAKVGSIEYPSAIEGTQAIHAKSGQSLDLVVLRQSDKGELARVKVSVDVSVAGTIGFYRATSMDYSNFVAMPVSIERPIDDNPDETETITLPASQLIDYPGSRITRIGDQSINTLREVQPAIIQQTENDFNNGFEEFTIPVEIELPLPIQPDGTIPTVSKEWKLSRTDIESLRDLGWTLPGSIEMVNLFEFAQVIDKAKSPMGAISRGIGESRRVMLQTYLTFLRLFEGSVKVKHLKGPVGIAHIGTQVASQGWVWVLFFMALISINLAVINFLPLPIVDGGQFLMLVYEWIRGKPVPVIIQNVTTMAGLLMIGTIFLYVTFNDIKAIFGA